MLFTKIREELNSQLSDNLKKINGEINEIKSKQSMLSTMESKNTQEQRQLVESMNKPAEMLDQMKSQWETIMSEQTETMRELVNNTVTSALEKEQMKKSIAPADALKGNTSPA